MAQTLNQSERRSHYLAIPLVTFCYGINWPTLALAVREMSPWSVRAITLGAAGIVLAGFNLMRGASLQVPRAQWPCLLAFTLLSMVAQNVLISYSQLLAPSGRMAIVFYSMPIWTTLLATAWLRERLDSSRKVSVALGAFGLLSLAWPVLMSGQYLGLLFALLAAWCWAASVIIFKRFPISATPAAMATWQLVLGALFVVPGMLALDGFAVVQPISPVAAVSLTWNVVSLCVSQVLWFVALGRAPASLVALGVLMVPSIAMLGSMAILGEVPSSFDYVGLVLVTVASAIVQLAPATENSTDV